MSDLINDLKRMVEDGDGPKVASWEEHDAIINRAIAALSPPAAVDATFEPEIKRLQAAIKSVQWLRDKWPEMSDAQRLNSAQHHMQEIIDCANSVEVLHQHVRSLQAVAKEATQPCAHAELVEGCPRCEWVKEFFARQNERNERYLSSQAPSQDGLDVQEWACGPLRVAANLCDKHDYKSCASALRSVADEIASERLVPVSAEPVAGVLWMDSEKSTVPCGRCGGDVVDFSIPNSIWNLVMRPHGKEGELPEYICLGCWHERLLAALQSRQVDVPAAFTKAFQCSKCEHTYQLTVASMPCPQCDAEACAVTSPQPAPRAMTEEESGKGAHHILSGDQCNICGGTGTDKSYTQQCWNCHGSGRI